MEMEFRGKKGDYLDGLGEYGFSKLIIDFGEVDVETGKDFRGYELIFKFNGQV